MTKQKNALLLIGSAKSKGSSTSEALGRYLCDRLVAQGWDYQAVHVHSALRTEEHTRATLEAVDASDLVLLAAPLYVDCLPYLVIRTLETLAYHRSGQDSETVKSPQFAAIINCGFPEAVHNDVAIAICEQFASQTNMAWAGGLSLGGGGFIGGKDPAELRFGAKSICQSLDMASDALAMGQPVPTEAIDLLAKPAIPAWLYTTVGNLGWHLTSWQEGVHGKLWDQPLTRV